MKKIFIFSNILLILLIVCGSGISFQKSQAQTFPSCEEDNIGRCLPFADCENDIMEAACYNGGVCCSLWPTEDGAYECFFACHAGWSVSNYPINCNGGSGCYDGKTCCIKGAAEEVDEAEINKKEYGIYNVQDILDEVIKISKAVWNLSRAAS